MVTRFAPLQVSASGEQDLIAVPPTLTQQPLYISPVTIIVTKGMNFP